MLQALWCIQLHSLHFHYVTGFRYTTPPSTHYSYIHFSPLHHYTATAFPHSISQASHYFSWFRCYPASTVCFCRLRQFTKAKPYHWQHLNTTSSTLSIAHSIRSGTCFFAMLRLNTMLYFPVVFNPS